MTVHHTAIEYLLPGVVAPIAVFGASIFAQSQSSEVDWTQTGALGALVLGFGFLLTKLIPDMNAKNSENVSTSNETIRQIDEKHGETVKAITETLTKDSCSQRAELFAFFREQQNVIREVYAEGRDSVEITPVRESE